MSPVNEIGFTELCGDAVGGPQGAKKVNIIFVHGLRGHPLRTWTSSQSKGSNNATATSSRSSGIKSLFQSKNPAGENTGPQKKSSGQQQVFWPRDFLLEDIPQARVWTYGYNADVTGGLFQANNQNSVSKHGRDLRVKLEREVDDQVILPSEKMEATY
ncbi:hypothetical protein ACLMJK_005600 [Lecanora helva]